MNANHPDDWLSRREAATYARVSVATIDRAIRAGKLRAKKQGGRVVIRRRWVDVYLLAALPAAVVLMLLAGLCLACAAGVEMAQDAMQWVGWCPVKGRMP